MEELLKRAKLPFDTFLRENPCVTSAEYYRFMKATKEKVVPRKVTVKKAFDNPNYEKFLGIGAQIANENRIVFSSRDAEPPFIIQNDSIWHFFEPELKKRLSEMEMDHSFSAKVRRVLVEFLPAGRTSVEEIAYLLGYQDLKSFFRAFSFWTGKSVMEYKKETLSENNFN